MAAKSNLPLVAGVAVLVVVLLVAGFFLFAGGEGGTTTPGEETATQAETPTQTQETPVGESEEKVRVLVLFDVGGRGDLSFNDMAALGADRAAEELGVEVDFQTPKSVDLMNSLLESVSKTGEYDLIVLVGFLWQRPLEEVAPKYPQQKYALIDAAPSTPLDNVAAFLFREQEVASLVGVLAADMAKNIAMETGEDAKAGAVAGIAIPPLWRFHVGYLYGIQYYNQATGSNVQLVWTYTGAFDDVALGRQTAEAMLQQGVRVFYGVAGLTHVGMFDAVRDAYGKGVIAFSIGQDASQEWYHPETIIVSGLKRVDTAVYTAIKMVVEGEFRGGTVSLGIKEGGLGISDEEIIKYFAEIAAQQGKLAEGLTPDDVVRIVMEQRERWISSEAWNLVDELKEKIINGEIVFVSPGTNDEYESIISELAEGNLDAALEK